MLIWFSLGNPTPSSCSRGQKRFFEKSDAEVPPKKAKKNKKDKKDQEQEEEPKKKKSKKDKDTTKPKKRKAEW